jgi:hypothetical protein
LKRARPDLYDKHYTTPLGVIAAPVAAQAQPCDHVYEARPIDGSRSALVPVEAVCRKCGARGGALAGKVE